jgi:hypothetical protein
MNIIKQKSIISTTNIDISLKYTSAGSFFTNEKLVLCGYQQNKKISNISGFGGKKELKDKTYIETAIRETLEELFDIIPDKEITNIINMNIIHKNVLIQDEYCMLTYTFDDLETILHILNKFQIKSNLYDNFPLTISELIFNRKIDSKSEISHLCLLPLKENILIDNDFIKDINYFLAQK